MPYGGNWTLNVSFTRQAQADLTQIHSYIANHNPVAAGHVVSRIHQVCQMFEAFPLLGSPWDNENTRKFAIPGLPYVIYYEIISETDLHILTIVHCRKRFPAPS